MMHGATMKLNIYKYSQSQPTHLFYL